jgi:hypothetical protein
MPYQYDTVVAFAEDLLTMADTVRIDQMAVVGLSGGRPYPLGCGAAMPEVSWPSVCSVVSRPPAGMMLSVAG